MRRLPLTYGFKGPERQDVLRKSMIGNKDKVKSRLLVKTFSLERILHLKKRNRRIIADLLSENKEELLKTKQNNLS